MLKKEIKKFIIAFILISLYLVYYNSGCFRNSIIESIKTTFLFPNLLTAAIAVFIYLVAYAFYDIIYLIIKYFFRKRVLKISLMNLTTLVISATMLILFINDQCIIQNLKPYKIMDDFVTENKVQVKIDSTNFSKYVWQKKSIEFMDGEYLVKEKVIFGTNKKLKLIGCRTRIDRYFLLRKIFHVSHDYELNGKYIYLNATPMIDSSNQTYTIQIRKNKLYLNSIINAI